jgi:hypothetical protein
MTKQPYDHRHSALFLMEIITAILFFSLISAVCLRLFVYSRQLSQHTSDVSFAVTQLSSIAELLEYAESPEQASALLQNYYAADSDLSIFYDADHTLCPRDDALYVITITGDGDDLWQWQLQADRTDGNADNLYCLQLEVYYAP